jgi:hypothetical protein
MSLPSPEVPRATVWTSTGDRSARSTTCSWCLPVRRRQPARRGHPGRRSVGGFPVLSVLPGQFLLKDLVLVSASLWTRLADRSPAVARRE